MPIGERRTWWVVFGLLSVASTAWALVLPLMSGHDEAAHAVRGAAVVRGQALGRPAPEAFPQEPNVFIEVSVPEAYQLGAAVGCFNRKRHLTPECAPPFEGGWEREWVLTYQFRSQPAYYAAVGWPSLLEPAAAGVYGMRIVSGLICSALVASALVSARVGRDPRWRVLGVAVALTPEVLYLSGSINSNAVEIAAAIALWTALLAITRVDGPPDGRLIARAGVAGVILVSTRGLSPMFGALIVAAVAVLLGWRRCALLLRRRDVQAWSGAIAFATVASLAYIEWVRRQLPITRPGQGLETAVDMLGWYLRQAVGIFGSNDIPLPAVVYALWAGAVVVVVGAAVLLARPRAIVVLGCTIAAGIAVQVGAEGFSLPPIGFFWQGRYALPLLVGVPLLATSVVTEGNGRHPARGRHLATAALPLALLLVAGHVIGFLQSARRFGVTLDGPRNPVTFLLSPDWTPPTGSPAVYVAVFSAALVAAFVVASLRPAAPPAGA